MSPRCMDSSQLDFDNFHCSEKQNKTHGISALKGNNDQIADDRSVSKDQSCKLGMTFVERILWRNMFQTRTMTMNGWRWMETTKQP